MPSHGCQACAFSYTQQSAIQRTREERRIFPQPCLYQEVLYVPKTNPATVHTTSTLFVVIISGNWWNMSPLLDLWQPWSCPHSYQSVREPSSPDPSAFLQTSKSQDDFLAISYFIFKEVRTIFDIRHLSFTSLPTSLPNEPLDNQNWTH